MYTQYKKRNNTSITITNKIIINVYFFELLVKYVNLLVVFGNDILEGKSINSLLLILCMVPIGISVLVVCK